MSNIIICLMLLFLSIGAYIFKTGLMSSIMILSAFIMSCFGLIMFLRRKQFISFLFTTAYLTMFFPNPFLVSLDVFPLESSNVQLYAFTNFQLIFGIMLFFFGTYITKANVMSQNKFQIYLTSFSIITILCIVFFVALSAVCVAIVFGGGLAALQASRAELAAGSFGFGVRGLSLYMFFPFLVAAPLLIIQLPKPLQIIPWIITATILVLNFFLFRARTPLVTVLVSSSIGILLKNRILFLYNESSFKARQSFLNYLIVGILAILVVVGSVVITYIRGSVGLGGIQLSHGFAKVWVESTFDGGDLGYQKIQRAAYEVYPYPNKYLLGQSYYRLLLSPIPRFIMPNKPENTSRVFCGVVNPSLYNTGGTIPPGIIGDLYINFGKFGIIGMFIYGLIIGRERYLKFWQWVMLGGAMTWVFHFVRGEFANSFVIMCVYLIVSLTLEKIIHPDYIVEETEYAEEDYNESEYQAN
jgi:oligosaccharide repeat unit polymerase